MTGLENEKKSTVLMMRLTFRKEGGIVIPCGTENDKPSGCQH